MYKQYTAQATAPVRQREINFFFPLSPLPRLYLGQGVVGRLCLKKNNFFAGFSFENVLLVFRVSFVALLAIVTQFGLVERGSEHQHPTYRRIGYLHGVPFCLSLAHSQIHFFG